MTVALRDLREDELAWMADAETELFGEGAWSKALIADDWRHGANRYRVIEADGERAGYTVYGFEGDAFHVLNLAVLPPMRRRGLGAAALDEAIAEAARLRTSQVWLEVAVTNEAALALYRSRGFQEVRIRRKYYQPGDVDALVMVLELERFTPR